MSIDAGELETRFAFHPASVEQVEDYETIRQMAHDFAVLLSALCPESDELRIAVDHVDAAVMFANASIARRT